MTLREAMQRQHPEAVGPQYFGGVARCPCNWGFEIGQPCKSGPKEFRDPEDCRSCWDRDLREVHRED